MPEAAQPRQRWLMPLLRTAHPQVWSLDLLVLLPMLAAHSLNRSTLKQSLVAFVALALCSASAALFQAAGTRRVMFACGAVLLAASALLLARRDGPMLLAASAAYLGAALAHRLYLQRLPLAGSVSFAILCGLRVLAACASTGIPPQPWLLAGIVCLALSLALQRQQGAVRALRRTWLAAVGIAGAVLAVGSFALYSQSDEVRMHDPQPDWLWAAITLLACWLAWRWTQSMQVRH